MFEHILLDGIERDLRSAFDAAAILYGAHGLGAGPVANQGAGYGTNTEVVREGAG